MAAMVQSALDNNWATARTVNREFFRLMQAHFLEASPAPIKAVLAMLGHGEDVLRLPMVPVSAVTRKKLEALLAELGLLVNGTIPYINSVSKNIPNRQEECDFERNIAGEN